MNMRLSTPFGQRTILLLFLSAGLCGCAHYRYSVVQPANLAATVGKDPVSLDYSPLRYQLAERDDRLALRINNTTDSPVTLLGNRSYLVTPKGESQPLKSAIIAPHSFIGMAFPPAPSVYRAYPHFGWGFGFGGPLYYHGSHFAPYAGFSYYNDPFYYGPTDYYLVNPHGYWEWKTGEMRLHLSYQGAPTNTFDHEFLFLRQKVK